MPYKTYISPGGVQGYGVSYIFDPNLIITNSNDNTLITTGGFRPLANTDFMNVTISGVEVVVGSIAVTGSPNVTNNGGGVTVYPANSTGANNYVASGGAGQALITGNILLSNTGRLQAYVQNIGSGSSLYVKLGLAPCSAQSFSFILKNASTDFGSDGGVWSSDGFYTGPISISGQTRYIGWES